MLRQLVEAWQDIPQWLRVLIGVQVVAAGCVMRVTLHRAGLASDGPAGFTIGFGAAVVTLALRRPASDDEAASRDGE